VAPRRGWRLDKGGNIGVVDDLVVDHYVDHDPPPGVAGDEDGFRQLAEMVTTAFSTERVELDEYLDTSDGRARPRRRDLPLRRRTARRALGRGRHGRRLHEGRSATRMSR
jgi:hypothetical protein